LEKERALLHELKILFLDEPTAGLDPEAAREVRELIKQLGEERRTIFLSTHNLSEAEQLCDRIAVIQTRLVALDTPEGLRQRLFRSRVVVQLEDVDSRIIEAAKELESVQGLEKDGNQLTVELAEPEQNRPALVRQIVEAGGRVLEISEEKHSLEEVYLSLVQEEEGR
jgi:ABC-2 type transport system ATP-binding protein